MQNDVQDILEFEKKRADNIIWTLSEKYDWQSKDVAYLKNEASLYGNMIIGATYRFYSDLVADYKSHLIKNVQRGYDFAKIFDICVDENVYLRLLQERPAIEKFRHEYYQFILNEFEYRRPVTVEENLNYGNAQRIMGLVPKIPHLDMKLLYRIIGIASLPIQEMILEFTKIIKERFHFDDRVFQEEFFEEFFERFEKRQSSAKEESEEADDENYDIQSAEFTGRAAVGDVREEENPSIEYVNKVYSKKQVEKYINENFGVLSVSADEIRRLQSQVCKGVHEEHGIHITRGRFPNSVYSGRRLRMQAQRETNIDYYNANVMVNNRHINRLHSLLKYELQNVGNEDLRTDHGRLLAEQVWRRIYLEDEKIFSAKQDEDFSFYHVNILIDSSASQRERQHIVSSQAYVISKSLEKLSIPLRIWGFSSLRNYTVLTLYKDFHEKNEGDVFGYLASHSNRDGLAIAALTDLMQRDGENHLLIVISDGKPNDCRVNANSLKDVVNKDYTGEMAVRDTAMQVRYARNQGIKVFGIFYGDESEVDAMKMIYGHNFAYIKNAENFADIVAFYLKNELKKR